MTGGSSRYGDETDAGLHATLSDRFSLELQFGDYRVGSFSASCGCRRITALASSSSDGCSTLRMPRLVAIAMGQQAGAE